MDEKNWKYYGTYPSRAKAAKVIATERAHGHKGCFSITQRMMGKSVDRAYSDKDGYVYIVKME
jgi:hypothetical protein